MPSALAIVGALTIAAVGASGMYAFDRHGPIGWHANLLLAHPGFDLPDSLAAQRDKAMAQASAAAQATVACRAAIQSQNQAVASQSALSASALAEARAAVAKTTVEARAARAKADKLRAYVPKGDTEAARWEDADRAVKGSFSP